MSGNRTMPNLWNQFDLEQLLSFDLDKLQSLVDRHLGPQPRMNRWRLSLLLSTQGKPMREYERVNKNGVRR